MLKKKLKGKENTGGNAIVEINIAGSVDDIKTRVGCFFVCVGLVFFFFAVIHSSESTFSFSCPKFSSVCDTRFMIRFIFI